MTDLIITGQFKKPKNYLKTINAIPEYRDAGIKNIIQVIWKNDQNNNLIVKAKKAGITFIKLEYPGDGFTSLYYQNYMLNGALEQSKASYILKSRADIFIHSWAISEIILNATIPARDLSSRFWVPWFEPSKPFYLGDEVYFGHIDDVKSSCKLIFWDDMIDIIGAGHTHIRKYLPLFEGNNHLKKFYSNFGDLGFSSHERFVILQKNLQNEDYAKELLNYYDILENNFTIGLSSDFGIEFQPWNRKKLKLDPNSLFKRIYSFDPRRGQIFVQRNDAVDMHKKFVKESKTIKILHGRILNTLINNFFYYFFKKKQQK